jgi:hypothetical protein
MEHFWNSGNPGTVNGRRVHTETLRAIQHGICLQFVEHATAYHSYDLHTVVESVPIYVLVRQFWL